MSQHDQVINDGPGATVRSDFNAALAALFSTSSGNTEPAVKSPGMLWFDTSVVGSNVLKMRDQANTAWIQISPVVQPSARAHRSGGGNVSLSTNAWTKINLTTLGVNTGGFVITSNSLVVPRAGTYLVNASIYGQTGTATNDLLCGISINGTTTNPTFVGRVSTSSVSSIWAVNVTGLIALAASNTLELCGYSIGAGSIVQDSAGATGLIATMVAAA